MAKVAMKHRGKVQGIKKGASSTNADRIAKNGSFRTKSKISSMRMAAAMEVDQRRGAGSPIPGRSSQCGDTRASLQSGSEDPLRLNTEGPVLLRELRRHYVDDVATSSPTIPVVLLDAYQERSSTISSHPIEIPAYVPFFQTGDPKPITRGITGPSGHYARPSVAHVCH